MAINETTSSDHRTDRWTPARIFRSTLALTLGLLTALVVVVGGLYLVFGTGGGGTLVVEETTVEDVVVEE
jgi:hypothetical protein